MTVGTHLGPIRPVRAPKGTSPTRASVVAGPTLVALTMIARYTAATTIRKL